MTTNTSCEKSVRNILSNSRPKTCYSTKYIYEVLLLNPKALQITERKCKNWKNLNIN